MEAKELGNLFNRWWMLQVNQWRLFNQVLKSTIQEKIMWIKFQGGQALLETRIFLSVLSTMKLGISFYCRYTDRNKATFLSLYIRNTDRKSSHQQKNIITQSVCNIYVGFGQPTGIICNFPIGRGLIDRKILVSSSKERLFEWVFHHPCRKASHSTSLFIRKHILLIFYIQCLFRNAWLIVCYRACFGTSPPTLDFSKNSSTS